MRVLFSIFAVFVVVCLGLAVPAASQDTPGGVDGASFFSGVVAEFAADHIVVSRTILGKSPEKRLFAIVPETRVQGQVKVRSRVTVRFAQNDAGDVAVSIVVRDGKKK